VYLSNPKLVVAAGLSKKGWYLVEPTLVSRSKNSMAHTAVLLLACSLLLSVSSAAPALNQSDIPASISQEENFSTAYSLRPELYQALGDVTYGGSGCAEGSATLTTSGARYTLQFHGYSAEIEGGSHRDRKTCNVIIPVQAPPNHRVAVSGLYIGGKAKVPNDAHAYGEARAEYFFAGSLGPVMERTFEPGFDSDWGSTEEHWVRTECGAGTNFRVSSSVQARTAQGTGVALQTMSFEFFDVEC